MKEVSSAGEKIDDLAAALIARVDNDRLAVVARLRHFEAQRRRMRRAICTRAVGRHGDGVGGRGSEKEGRRNKKGETGREGDRRKGKGERGKGKEE